MFAKRLRLSKPRPPFAIESVRLHPQPVLGMRSILFFIFAFAVHLHAAEGPFADAVVLWPKRGTDTGSKPASAEMQDLAGKALTLSVKLRMSALDAPASILGWKGRGARSAVRVFSDQVKSNSFLRAELSTDARNRALQLSLPLESLG